MDKVDRNDRRRASILEDTLTRRIQFAVVVAASMWAATMFPYDAARAATSGTAWSANGATACDKYLTPEVTGAILNAPAGKAMSNDGTSCNVGPIYLTLKAGNVAVFQDELPRIFGAHSIGGIGDAAFWNEAGALSSVKSDRECDIAVIVPGAAKFSGAVLGQKLGAICNQLFALP